MSHDIHWNPAVRELVAREVAAAEQRGAERVAQAVERLADDLPELTEGKGRAGTARWPERDRNVYSLAIEEAQAVIRDTIRDEHPTPEPSSEATEAELRAIIRNAIALNDPAATAQWMRDHLHVTRRDDAR